ncbi:MAG: hypothetical protein SD837_22035 [Candidatus Electrothrix scaldis]|nr:MAG: hypothetical protein SD837_22035 [Candidatus Electrothrix sp. GW3-3]
MNPDQFLDLNISILQRTAPRDTLFGISTVQRLCRVGYNQAARTVERFIEQGGLIRDVERPSQYRLVECPDFSEEDLL